MNKIAGNRIRKYPDLTFMKGSQFFNITHGLATYIVQKENLIKKIFRFSYCSDEIVIQTFAYNSPFAENLAHHNIRYIDWSKHGKSPEILTLNHYEDLIKSDRLFARKFSSEKSKDLIAKLYREN